MPNIVATAALATFPLFAACMFLFVPFRAAVLCVVLVSQLMLPVGVFIKFEGIPQFDKVSIPSLCLIVACIVSGKFKFQSFKSFGLVEIFAIMYLLGPVITSELNGDTLTYGPRVIPGVGLYDAFSAFVAALFVVTPFFVAREFFREEADLERIMRFMVISAIAYSLPLLFEVRFSPQLHYWVYGVFPGSFEQSVRNDGFRPMVFMGHGLTAAHFMMLSLLAAMSLWRTRSQLVAFSPRPPALFWLPAGYLAVILYFCRTLGAGIYGLILSLFIMFTSPKVQVRVATVLVFLALLYPCLRYSEAVPADTLVDIAKLASADRADSLKFRFDNERVLLDRAVERPVFGWGRFGRNRVYEEETGKELTITDGEWIITLGQFGAVGFIAQFGLLSIAVFKTFRAVRFVRSYKEGIYIGALALMVAVSIFDLLPNALLMPWTWLITGALLGTSEALLRSRSMAGARAARSGDVPPYGSRYGGAQGASRRTS